MSITSTLNNAISGLNVTQRDLDVVANNIANSETEGFTRRTLSQTETVTNGINSGGVRATGVNRILDEQVQSQLRELGGINVGNQVTADFLGRLDVAFGEPGSPAAIDTSFNAALSSLEALSTTPDASATQFQAITDLQVFAGQLNSLSNTIQSLRQEADSALEGTVRQANEAITNIAELNARIIAQTSSTSEPVALLDERDRFVDELAQIIDIDVTNLPNNGIQIRTVSGIAIFDNVPTQFEFNAAGTVAANSSVENGLLSSVSLTSASGSFSFDILASNGVRNGALGAYAELRDTTLVQAQAQLDAFAAQLSLAVSNTTVASTPVTDGLAIDTAGIADGNTVALSFTGSAGVARNVTLVQVSDPSQLPLDQGFTANTNDIVIGVDFSSPSAVSDIQSQIDALAPGNGVIVATGGAATFQFSATTPASIDGLEASITNSSLTDGLPFALFEDRQTGEPFTNAPGTSVGLAGRLAVSEELISDPSLLARFDSSSSSSGDSSRVNFILEQIRGEITEFSPSTGIGAPTNPVNSTVEDFLQTIISNQGQRAAAVERNAEISQISFNNVQDRIQAESGVNIDVEISRLIELEQAFQANARILTAVQDLIDTLFAAVR